MVKDLIIESTDLTKAYGPHVALDSLNIKIEKGATGLLGPNGAGKVHFPQDNTGANSTNIR